MAYEGPHPFPVQSGGTGNVTLTQHGVLVGEGDSPIAATSPGTANQVLQSGGAAADPTWSTATYPSTTTANQLLYSSASNTVSGLSTANNGVLITSGGGIPSISSTLPSTVQGNITSLGTITSGTWNGTVIGPTYGGTGVNNGSNTLTISGNSTINQDVSTTGNPTFASLNNTPIGNTTQSTGRFLNATLGITSISPGTFVYFVSGDSFASDRNLIINLGNGSRTLNLFNTLTVNAASTINQDVSTTGNPSFASLNNTPIGNTTASTGKFTNTGFSIQSPTAANALQIVPGSSLTANRTFTLTTGDSNRTLTLTGDATLNQDVSTAGTPNFTGASINSVGINTGFGLNALDVLGGVAIGTYAGEDISPSNGMLVSGFTSFGSSSNAERMRVQLNANSDIGLRVTDGTTAGNIVIQPLTSTLSGFMAINFNGYFSGSEQRYNTSKNRWRLFCDQRSTDDKLEIDTYNGTSGTTNIRMFTDGSVTMPTQPSFIVKQTATVTFAQGVDQTVTFNSEISDRGNDFASNTFTAPQTGLYLFTMTGMDIGNFGAATRYFAKIVTSNRSYAMMNVNPTAVNPASNGPMFSGSCIADMDVGDVATLVVFVSGGSANFDILGTNETIYFTGMLLA